MIILKRLALLSLIAAALAACSPKINLLPDYDAPLQEIVLQGSGPDKILVIPVTGIIDDASGGGFFFPKPSVVEEVVAALEKARHDPAIKAVILRIDSPGGTATASDILNREIGRFKEEQKVKIVSLLMDTATSGGYYVAVTGDRIIAHPTTVTGSIGVIFFAANIEGLMDKIGVEAEPIKSGKYKDLGSPFRPMSAEERLMLQKMIDEMYERFLAAVGKGRPALTADQVRTLADGRIYTAGQALEAKLIDRVGYVNDAIEEAKKAAALPDGARVVIYRRNVPSNDTVYNTRTASGPDTPKLFDLGLSRFLFVPRTGFYYLWSPGAGTENESAVPVKVVLVEPEIPPNTGSVARMCAGMNIPLHLVEPLGFSLEDRYLKRAGLDYWPYVDLTVHPDWETFYKRHGGERMWLVTKRAERPYTSVRYHPEDVLVFGKETLGLPEGLIEANPERAIGIPIIGNIRSYNLSNAVSIVLFEALRQTRPELFRGVDES